MLRILLDEHISPAVARQLRARNPELAAVALQAWDNGAHLGEPDDLLLEAAYRQRLTLVTYDQRTIPVLLKAWSEQGRDHGGVVFVDTRTIAPSDIGALVRGLEQLFRQRGAEVWIGQVVFLSAR